MLSVVLALAGTCLVAQRAAPATRPAATEPIPAVELTALRVELPGRPRKDPVAPLPMSRAGRLKFTATLSLVGRGPRPAPGSLTVDARTAQGQKLAARVVPVAFRADASVTHVTEFWERPVGSWPPGRIDVVLHLHGRVVGRSAFRIVDDRDAHALRRRPLGQPRLKLFAASALSVPAEKRRYDTRFMMGATAVVGWELRLRNELYMLEDTNEWLEVRWIDPLSKPLTVQRQRVVAKKEWFEILAWSEYGFKGPGRWRPGRYTIECIHDSRVLASATFEILDDRDPDLVDREPLAVRSLHFFAGAGKASRGGERRAVDRLPMSTTTFVGWELELLHRRFALERTHGFLVAKWYGPFPPGSPAASQPLEKVEPRWVQHVSVLLEKDDSLTTRSSQWGFRDPGRWLPGVYRVTFHFREGQLATGQVRIVDDRDREQLAAKGLEMRTLIFYRPQERPRGKPVYTPDEVRDLRWRVVCRNHLYGVGDVTQVLELRWFTRDGLLLDERQVVVKARVADWFVAAEGRVADVLGSPPIEDTYRIEIWRQDRLVGRARLDVAARPAGP